MIHLWDGWHRDARNDSIVLCLCEGNYVRSILAAGIIDRIASARDDHFFVESAGTTEWGEDRNLPPTTLALLKEMGCPIPIDKKPHKVTAGELAEAAIILCMDHGQLAWLKENAPQAEGRALLVSVLTGTLEELPNANHEDAGAVRYAAAWLEWHLIRGYPALLELVGGL